MIDKIKLDGAVEKSSAEQQIHKSDLIVHIMWSLKPGSYGRW